MLKQNIFSLLWHPLIKPIEGVTQFPSSDAALWCRGDRGWETPELPASLRSMPVVHLQGEEGCQRLPCSLLDPSPTLPSPEVMVD